MLAGHLAAAFIGTRVEPRVPLATAVGAAFALDLVWPLLLLAGLETVRVHPGDTAFTNLAFDAYPWSHSLLTAVAWSGLAGVVAGRAVGSARAGLVVGGLVLSHWILDAVTHRPDLPLWPGGPLVGAGLWNSVPGTLAVEGGLLAVATLTYTRAFAPLDATGTWALAGLVALIGALWALQPWTPPPPSSSAVAWGALVLWLLLPWSRVISRHRVLHRVA